MFLFTFLWNFYFSFYISVFRFLYYFSLFIAYFLHSLSIAALVAHVSDCRQESQNCDLLANNYAQVVYSLAAIWQSIFYSYT